MGRLRTPWTSQPQGGARLNLENPLVKKLRYCSLLGGNALDLVSGKLAVVNGGAPSVPTQLGLARSFSSASSQSLTLPTTNMVSGYPLTVACWARTTPTGAGQILYSLNGTTYHAVIGYLNAALALQVGATHDPLFNRQVAVPAGLNYLVAIYRSNTWDLYINGVRGAQGTLTNGNWGEPAAGNHSIGSRLGGASLRYNDGTISDFCVFEGELSGTEIRSLTNNPWQIFQPLARTVFSKVAAAGGAHATSGTLVGGGTAVAGTAARKRVMTSSGALNGSGAELAGTARSNHQHPASGTLSGGGAALSGTAARAGGAVTHTTSGTLSGQGAALTGTAARTAAPVTHATSGSLTGGGTTLSGTAQNGAIAPPIFNSGGGGAGGRTRVENRRELDDLLTKALKKPTEVAIQLLLPASPSPEALATVRQALTARSEVSTKAMARQVAVLLEKLQELESELDEEAAVMALLLD